MIEQGAYILIAAGAFIFIISFLGYCGAIKESRVLLTAYGLFIIIIALLQITAIVLATIYKSQAEEHTNDFFLYTIRKYYTTKRQRDAVTLSWDFMMAEVNKQLTFFIVWVQVFRKNGGWNLRKAYIFAKLGFQVRLREQIVKCSATKALLQAT